VADKTQADKKVSLKKSAILVLVFFVLINIFNISNWYCEGWSFPIQPGIYPVRVSGLSVVLASRDTSADKFFVHAVKINSNPYYVSDVSVKSVRLLDKQGNEIARNTENFSSYLWKSERVKHRRVEGIPFEMQLNKYNIAILDLYDKEVNIDKIVIEYSNKIEEFSYGEMFKIKIAEVNQFLDKVDEGFYEEKKHSNIIIKDENIHGYNIVYSVKAHEDSYLEEVFFWIPNMPQDYLTNNLNYNYGLYNGNTKFSGEKLKLPVEVNKDQWLNILFPITEEMNEEIFRGYTGTQPQFKMKTRQDSQTYYTYVFQTGEYQRPKGSKYQVIKPNRQ
jgi:hypothetical protein